MPHCDTTHEKNEQPYAEDAKDSQRTQRKPMDLLAFCVLCEISASSAFGGWRFPINHHSKPCLAGHHHHSRVEPGFLQRLAALGAHRALAHRAPDDGRLRADVEGQLALAQRGVGVARQQPHGVVHAAELHQLRAAGQRGLRFDDSVQGSGLGLHIATQMVQAYGGDLSLGKSALLKGLSVRVVLPGLQAAQRPRKA